MSEAKKTRKPGRPKLPKGNAKAAMVRVRATPDELRAIEGAAKASKETVSEWIRRSLEEAQVVKVMVRVLDSNENKYDWFVGPPQECPPIPRIGEWLECPAGIGTVKRIEHAVEEINTKKTSPYGPWDTYYKTIIRIE